MFVHFSLISVTLLSLLTHFPPSTTLWTSSDIFLLLGPEHSGCHLSFRYDHSADTSAVSHVTSSSCFTNDKGLKRKKKKRERSLLMRPVLPYQGTACVGGHPVTDSTVSRTAWCCSQEGYLARWVALLIAKHTNEGLWSAWCWSIRELLSLWQGRRCLQDQLDFTEGGPVQGSAFQGPSRLCGVSLIKARLLLWPQKDSEQRMSHLL